MNQPAEPTPATVALDRRGFLKTTATGLSMALTAPGLLLGQAAAAGGSAIHVALVGIGEQGRILMDVLIKIPGVRVVAVCDIWEYARTYGQRYLRRQGHEATAYEDYREMLDKERQLDAVIVATTDNWHAPISNDALRAGKHVYCEKMMSNTVAGARSMVQTMRATGKLLQIGHQRRSNPRYMVARTRLLGDAKLLGRVTAVNAQWNRAVGEDLGWPQRATMPAATLERHGFANMHQFRNWRWFKEYGGGPLSDLGAHQIDIFNWFLDATPATVFASGGLDYYRNREWPDNAMVIYEYALPEGTARAFYQVQTTTSAGGGYYEQFMGVHGTIKISENPKYTAIYREAAAPPWEEWIRRRYLAAPLAAAPVLTAQTYSDPGKVDARETAALESYRLPVVLDKAIHQPHLENFFNAIRGTATLNCPADEAFRSSMTIFKAVEAVEKRTLLTLKPEDFVA
jgi:predicted dehydrogenase